MQTKKSKKKKSKYTWTDIAKNPTTIIAVLLARPLLPDEYVPTFLIIAMMLLAQALHASFKLLRGKQKEGKAKHALALVLIAVIVTTHLSLAVSLVMHFIHNLPT